MKLSKDTIKIFENFADINDKLIIYKGKNQRVSQKNWLVEAEVEEDFPADVGIYDMKNFLTTYKLFSDPEIDFDNEYVIFREGKQKAKYRTAKTSLVEVFVPVGKKFTCPIDEEFILPTEALKIIKKATLMWKNAHIAFQGDGKSVSVRTFDEVDQKSSSMVVELGQTNKTFNMVVNFERMKMLDHDYRVQVSKVKIIQFHSQQMNIHYGFGCEATTSSFTG